MPYLTRDQILAAKLPEAVEVDVPEWGGTVLVRGMTGKERADYVATTVLTRGRQTVTDWSNLQAKLVGRCIVDEDGKRLFADADIEELGNQSAAALERVFDVAAKASGLSNEDMEQLAGNSAAAESGASTSS
jgi:hypothetical protein